jgi:hypothetical protein
MVQFFHDKRRAAAMITAGVIAGLIVAFVAIITGIIATASWFYRRGQEDQQAREDRARIASYIAQQMNRDTNHGDGGIAYKRRESARALVILAAAAVGWLITLRWWHPTA